MKLLNKPAYEMERDKLIYDGTHPVDGSAVKVKLDVESGGAVLRGTLIDYADGVYSIHKSDGEASLIAAESVQYAAEEAEAVVPVYVSGTFRKCAVISEAEITDTDVETLRCKGIYLK